MSAQKTYSRNRGLTNMKKSYKTALSGMLLALSAGLSAAESLIPLPLGFLPEAVKNGMSLCNN